MEFRVNKNIVYDIYLSRTFLNPNQERGRAATHTIFYNIFQTQVGDQNI